MKAFYFATEDRKLRYGDNRPIVVGETHEVDGPIEVCQNGLHASEQLLDALEHAPGCILYQVELAGEVVADKFNDKVAASRRTYLAEFDATELLREFARQQALINIELIKPYCTPAKFDLIVTFLQTGDADAARAARDAAAADAARDATYAAYAAADDAADAAARDDANKMLTDMVRDATGWDV